MTRRGQTCVHPDCPDERSRYSGRKFCVVHEDLAIAQDVEEANNSPEALMYSDLEQCVTVDDLKDFIRNYILQHRASGL